MWPQLLDLISNRVNLLKHLTEPLIREGGQTYIVSPGGKTRSALFQRPKEGPFPSGFDPSKKCEHHFRAEGQTLEECYQLRDRVQDLIPIEGYASSLGPREPP